jgi:hypothetical protein
MTKKHFIALADHIKGAEWSPAFRIFTDYHLKVLADFCLEQNERFDRGRWLNYIKKVEPSKDFTQNTSNK